MYNTTLVTGIWDLGRDTLSEGWSRNFDHYIKHFRTLLKNLEDIPFIVYIDPQLEDIVWECRKKENTTIIYHKKEDFSGNFFPFFDKIQEIRNSDQWISQSGWLKDSAQGSMEWYNPMVMSKMFMLHNAKIYNPYKTEFMYWIDGGITNTVHYGYFSKDNILSKLENIINKFLFICFPYEANAEIHGFSIDGMKKMCQSETVNRVARGGFFGGKVDYISKANSLYYSLLNDSLNNNWMGTEESIFTIMTYLDPSIYHYEMINENGLLLTFFEKLKNEETSLQINQKTKKYTNNKTILYINAFNSTEQLQMVLDSFEKYDINFINKTEKYLINNTTKEELFPEYDRICKDYDFIQIKRGNLGICRARQLAAEHFAELGSKYMLFFEDDMLLDFNGYCSVGFRKEVKNLYNIIIDIMDHENYDFLKLSFSEFFGDNSLQWSWHNVPEPRKTEYFGLSKHKPPTNFKHIKILNNIPYADGEVYYCNWPHIINQEGNQKLFLDTTWANPYEQTWMSHIYTLTKENKVNPAILLASPITHNRVHFYEANERKEN